MPQVTVKRCYRCGAEDDYYHHEDMRVCSSCGEYGTVYTFIEMADLLNDFHIHGYPVSVKERIENEMYL